MVISHITFMNINVVGIRYLIKYSLDTQNQANNSTFASFLTHTVLIIIR